MPPVVRDAEEMTVYHVYNIEGIGTIVMEEPIPSFFIYRRKYPENSLKTPKVKELRKTGKNFGLGLTKDSLFFIMIPAVSMM